MTLPFFRRPRSLFTNNWWHLGVCGYAGENVKQAERYIWWTSQKNLNVKVYNSYPKCFDSSINSKKKHVQHNCWSKLGNLTFHKTIFLFNQYLTFHIRSELGHFTCWGKIGAFFWDITITFWPKKYLTLNQSDAMKIWCKCTLARVVGEDKNSIQIASDAIDICFKFRKTN